MSTYSPEEQRELDASSPEPTVYCKVCKRNVEKAVEERGYMPSRLGTSDFKGMEEEE